eukprot:15348411-Alexandrium_andersonii.AAC.1
MAPRTRPREQAEKLRCLAFGLTSQPLSRSATRCVARGAPIKQYYPKLMQDEAGNWEQLRAPLLVYIEDSKQRLAAAAPTRGTVARNSQTSLLDCGEHGLPG